MKYILLPPVAILLYALFTTPVHAEQSRYGKTTFPNSGASEAQASFMEGLLMLHSFEYVDARKAFKTAREIDGDFAMAYWGEALTHYRVLWNDIELDKVRAVLLELGVTPQQRAAKAPSQREKDYLHAIEIFLGEGSDSVKALRYVEAMENLSADYPDDENAAAFYALALLGSSGPDRDYTIYMKSAAVSEAVIANNPLHPGAVHYLIHAYDDPVHAPLGLRPALTYARIAPTATHALHMPSHIFFPLGMWDAATQTNIKAYEAGQAWSQRNDKPVNGGGAHALTWLIYSLMQQGKNELAKNYLVEFQELATADPTRKGQFSEAWASYLVESDYVDTDWVNLEFNMNNMPARRASMIHFVKAAAAIRAGNIESAELHVASLAQLEMQLNDLNWSEKAKDVMLLELKALLQGARGNQAEAVRLLSEATSIEYAMPRRFGPPWPPKPSHELLGETLAVLGDNDGAREQFRLSLTLAKGRSISLLGLARSASAVGLDEEARRAYATLGVNWQDADTNTVPALHVVQ
jgi:hypothetical protein